MHRLITQPISFMKQLFTTISDRIKSAVPDIKWVDMDYGQADNFELRPALAFPAVLLRLSITPEEVGGSAQLIQATVQARVVFNPAQVRTSSAAPGQVRQAALQYLDTADEVYSCLHGYENPLYAAFEGKSKTQETRSDGLLVISFAFTTYFFDFQE